MLRSNGARLKQQYVAATDGELVQLEDRVKGYEFVKGQYVLFTNQEVKAMDAKSTGEINITEFVPSDQVTPLFVEKANFPELDKGAARSYHLLAEVMRKTGKSALAKYAARGKIYLVMLHPLDERLIMVQLWHQEELRSFADVELPDAEIQPAELDLAIQQIEQVDSEEFHPENYVDEIRHHMLDVIDKKINGQDIVVAQEEQEEAKIIDIMEALKASLASNESSSKPKRAAKKKTPAKSNKSNKAKAKGKVKKAASK